MKLVLHNSMEIKYDTFEELKEDLIKLKEKGFDILNGYKNYHGEWILNVVYTHNSSIMSHISNYGKHTKYEIIEDIGKVVLTGVN